MSSPAFAEAPLVRAFLRALLFATIIEAIFFRLLELPARLPLPEWAPDLRVTTGRAGMLMFFVAYGLCLATMMAIAYASLRRPAWPGPANALGSLGLLALTALGLSAAIFSQGPAFALGFALIALAVSLGMLAGMYETRKDAAGRAFAVLLAAALVCLTLQTVLDLSSMLPTRPLPARWHGPLDAAGRWLIFAAGALAYAAFAPRARSEGAVRAAAAYGVPAMASFALILAVVARPAVLDSVAGAAGPEGARSAIGILETSVAAAATFLVLFAALRAMMTPALRTNGYGLLFLLLSGVPHRIAYQHLLGVLGVALISAADCAPPLPSIPVFISPGEAPGPAPVEPAAEPGPVTWPDDRS
jgi:hypothetical protein